MTADATSVNSVGFLQSVSDAGVLRDVTIGQPNIPELLLCSVVHRPPHDGHQCRITKGCTPSDLQLERTAVVRLMTGLTQCYEVVRCITPGLTGFDVMDIENLVLRFSVAVLTGVIVAEQYIFTHVPEPHLFTLLVLLTLYVGVFEQLCIELRNLDDGFCHRKEQMDLAYKR